MVIKMKKPLAIIAAVVLTLLLAVSTAVPAFAAEPNTIAQSNEQFAVMDLKCGVDANNYERTSSNDEEAVNGAMYKAFGVALLGLALVVVGFLIVVWIDEDSVIRHVVVYMMVLVGIGAMVGVTYYMMCAASVSVASLRTSNTAIVPIPFFIFR